VSIDSFSSYISIFPRKGPLSTSILSGFQRDHEILYSLKGGNLVDLSGK